MLNSSRLLCALREHWTCGKIIQRKQLGHESFFRVLLLCPSQLYLMCCYLAHTERWLFRSHTSHPWQHHIQPGRLMDGLAMLVWQWGTNFKWRDVWIWEIIYKIWKIIYCFATDGVCRKLSFYARQRARRTVHVAIFQPIKIIISLARSSVALNVLDAGDKLTDSFSGRSYLMAK